jgi:hypothetical protein
MHNFNSGWPISVGFGKQIAGQLDAEAAGPGFRVMRIFFRRTLCHAKSA